MPAIHVVYDPKDKVMFRTEDMKRAGVSAIVMRLDNPITAERRHDIVVELAASLLNQVAEEG
jgi:hypothetical protein